MAIGNTLEVIIFWSSGSSEWPLLTSLSVLLSGCGLHLQWLCLLSPPDMGHDNHNADQMLLLRSLGRGTKQWWILPPAPTVLSCIVSWKGYAANPTLLYVFQLMSQRNLHCILHILFFLSGYQKALQCRFCVPKVWAQLMHCSQRSSVTVVTAAQRPAWV